MEGRFNGGFLALPVWWAYIWRGLYMEGLIFGILRYFRRERKPKIFGIENAMQRVIRKILTFAKL